MKVNHIITKYNPNMVTGFSVNSKYNLNEHCSCKFSHWFSQSLTYWWRISYPVTHVLMAYVAPSHSRIDGVCCVKSLTYCWRMSRSVTYCWCMSHPVTHLSMAHSQHFTHVLVEYVVPSHLRIDGARHSISLTFWPPDRSRIDDTRRSRSCT